MNTGGGNHQNTQEVRAPRDAALKVVITLREEGFEAYFAGGCVRDEVLGLHPKDYDVATDARPERVRRIFPHTRAVGEHFGVILVSMWGATIEVATFRADAKYSDSRRPDRVHFTNAEEDARRRDFTINGLFLDPVTNNVIDYVGGLDDIKAKVIRAIGRPADRLAEDHLRALRAVRFAARYNFQIEPATYAAIASDALALRGVSRERIGMEVKMMLEHPSRALAAGLMQSLGLDAPVLNSPNLDVPLPLLTGVNLDELDSSLDAQGSSSKVFAAALATWALDRGCDTRHVPADWRSALVLSNWDRDALAGILRLFSEVCDKWSDKDLTVAAKKRLASSEYFAPAVRIVGVCRPSLHASLQQEVIDLAVSFGGLAPEPFLTGDGLVSMGLTPGPAFKKILDAVYDAQLEGRVTNPNEARTLAANLANNS